VSRPAVTKKYHTGPTPGYDFLVPAPKSGVHTLCTVVRNVGAGLSRMLGCRVTPLGTNLNSTQIAAHSPSGVVSSVHSTASTMEFTGWANEPDYLDGRIVTVLYLDGSPAKTVNSHRATADQRQAGAGTRGAYDVTVPVSSGAHVGCIWVVNTGFGYNRLLGCKAADTRGPAGTGEVTTPKMNKAAVKEAKRHIGEPYVWGAEGPHKFDCSGLVMFSYHKAGYTTPRVSQDQFHAARVIPASRAVPGDLVFYHDNEGSVYHVGIYLSPGKTVAAIDTAEGVNYQSIDFGSATYGSFTHT
jgi:cell wall-associated NlpC family hydrolase